MILPADALAHEQMLMRKLGGSPKGLISESAAFELGSRLIEADPDHGDNLTRIRFDIESRSWWHIVILCPGPLLEMQRRQVPPPISRHGELVSPLPHHAVVLVEVERDRFLYLDPWFPRAYQPQSISVSEFARVWTGRYIPVRLP